MATYQSLYRRYRSQRFDEVLGQDHITQALRNAVREGRVGHAYLFSGPRGTGKTSTARILAKVLNCAAPEDGEPCGKCENCITVAEGRVTDWLLEQDAASKSKVDDMRDLLDRVPLGTSGNRKVIILDEVHMLSQGAENALLKTLEEPPSHVVFVLATTDPRKVRPTILSRTQHFTFRLLPPDVMAEHVRHVIADADLGIAPELVDQAVEHVVSAGGGSARDTLSLLDQVAALGAVVDEGQPVDDILDALADRDAGRVLVGVARALAAGRDPRGLGEALIAGLRDAFLSLMGVADEHLAPQAQARAAEVGKRFGAPGLTRALDVLGEALTELSRKPDPRVVVEVALIRLTQPSTDRTLESVLERLDRLERGGVSPAGPGPVPASTPGTPGSAPRSAGAAGTAESAVEGSASGTGGAAGTAESAVGGSPSTPPDGPGSGGGSRRAGAASGHGAASGDDTGPDDPATLPDAPVAASDRGTAREGGRATEAARDALSSARRADPPAPSAPPPGSGQPTLGAVKRGRAAKTSKSSAAATATTEPPASGGSPAPGSGTATATATSVPDGIAEAEPGTSTSGGGPTDAAPTPADIEAAWAGEVLAKLPVKIRSRWRAGRWTEVGDDDTWHFAVPNSWHQGACEEARPAVERALASHFGHPVAVAVVVDESAPDPSGPLADPTGGPGPAPSAGSTGPKTAGGDEDEHIDPSELRDADDAPGNGIDLVLREFGGGQVVEEGP